MRAPAKASRATSASRSRTTLPTFASVPPNIFTSQSTELINLLIVLIRWLNGNIECMGCQGGCLCLYHTPSTVIYRRRILMCASRRTSWISLVSAHPLDWHLHLASMPTCHYWPLLF